MWLKDCMFVGMVQGLRHVFWIRGKEAAGVENTCIPGPGEQWGDERASWQQGGGQCMAAPLQVQ